MAEKLKISIGAYNMYENGNRHIPKAIVNKIVNILHLKNDDILKSLGKFTNFTKDMNFKTLGIRLNDCLVPWNILDSVEYYFKTVYKIKFER